MERKSKSGLRKKLLVGLGIGVGGFGPGVLGYYVGRNYNSPSAGIITAMVGYFIAIGIWCGKHAGEGD